MSDYRICIIREDGHRVTLLPGGEGERSLKRAILDRVAEKGIGVGRTTAHVLKDLSDTLDEVLLELKSEVSVR